MSSTSWTPAEDELLRRHSRIGEPASTALDFWGAMCDQGLRHRTAKAIVERAAELRLYANSLGGAVERTCPDCGAQHIKRAGSRNPKTADLCIPCVRRRGVERRKENHKFTCVRCGQPSRGGRRRRVCSPCKVIWESRRLRT